ncbi:MAG: ribonuclease HI [Pseudomonadota bacterium]
MEHFAAHPDVLRTLAAQTAVSSPLPTEDKTMLKIYTDGACSGNPGPGGWGVLIMDGTESRTLCGGEPETTNNRMELTAAIEALRTAPNGAQIDLYTDSTYVKDGLNKWMANWKRNGWKTASKKPVKNKDLWIELDTLAAAHTVTWHWVKGHAGDPGNERADELAREGIDKYGR